MKIALGNRLHDIVAQHQVRTVGARNENALRSTQAACPTQVEEAFDLCTHSTDGLHFAELAYAAGDRDALVDTHVGERAEHGKELTRTCAVAVDLAVALFERELRPQTERALLPKQTSQIPAENGHAFGVNAAAELSLPFDVDDPFATDAHDGRDPHGLAELDVARAVHGQSIDDADARPLRVERDLAPQGHLAEPSLGTPGPLASLEPRGHDLLGPHDRIPRVQGCPSLDRSPLGKVLPMQPVPRSPLTSLDGRPAALPLARRWRVLRGLRDRQRARKRHRFLER